MEDGYDIENVKVIHETEIGKSDEGVLFVTAPDFGDEEMMIPKKVITEDSEVYERGGEGTLIVTEWFARKKGWT